MIWLICIAVAVGVLTSLWLRQHDNHTTPTEPDPEPPDTGDDPYNFGRDWPKAARGPRTPNTDRDRRAPRQEQKHSRREASSGDSTFVFPYSGARTDTDFSGGSFGGGGAGRSWDTLATSCDSSSSSSSSSCDSGSGGGDGGGGGE